MSDGFDDNDFPDMDVGDVDGTAIGSTITVDKPGKYHFDITEVRPQLARSDKNGHNRRPDILITCEVLEGVPGQSGRGSIYYHSLVVDGKGGGGMSIYEREAFSNFLCGLGILVVKDGKVTDPETGTSAINLRTIPERIRNIRQFIGDIKIEKSKDPQYADRCKLIFGRGVFLVDDPAVAGVPKNIAALKLIGKESAAAQAGASTAAAPPAKDQGKGTGRKAEAAATAAPAAASGGIDTSDL